MCEHREQQLQYIEYIKSIIKWKEKIKLFRSPQFPSYKSPRLLGHTFLWSSLTRTVRWALICLPHQTLTPLPWTHALISIMWFLYILKPKNPQINLVDSIEMCVWLPVLMLYKNCFFIIIFLSLYLAFYVGCRWFLLLSSSFCLKVQFFKQLIWLEQLK